MGECKRRNQPDRNMESEMGYTTEFDGILKFARPITTDALAELTKYLGKDRRDIGYAGDTIYEGGKYGSYWYHIDYELADDFSGIKWNGAEKAYDMEHIANWLIDKMREKFSDFTLMGFMNAKGDEFDDRWVLTIENNRAVKRILTIQGKIIKCPHCEEKFVLESVGE